MSDSIPTSVQLYHFIDDLEASLGYRPDAEFDCDNIVLCGFGGSAVSGYFAADCCYTESRKYIHLLKYPELPNWVGPRTLAIVSSYSGNTAETLALYTQAKSKGCVVVAVTSGGKLRQFAEDGGDHLVLLPTGMHPRHAIGYMIGYTLAIIRAAGGPDLEDRIRAIVPSLRKYRDDVALSEDGLARSLAKDLGSKVPVICSDTSMQSVAFRWKTQINENSKFVAFCDSVPQFQYSGLDAWVGTTRDNYMLVMLLGSDDDISKGTSYLEHAANLLESSDANHRVIRLGGSSTFENMFRAIILGDYMSVYMAENRGIDPAEVRPVMQMKAKLAERRGE